jgi:hypothetical protein
MASKAAAGDPTDPPGCFVRRGRRHHRPDRAEPHDGYLVSAVESDDAKLAIATTALGVIGGVTGAFFGIKSATDSRRDAQDNAEQTQQKLNRVINATDKHDEAVKEALEG